MLKKERPATPCCSVCGKPRKNNLILCDACCDKLQCEACGIVCHPDFRNESDRTKVGHHRICHHCKKQLENNQKIVMWFGPGRGRYLYRNGQTKEVPTQKVPVKIDNSGLLEAMRESGLRVFAEGMSSDEFLAKVEKDIIKSI